MDSGPCILRPPIQLEKFGFESIEGDLKIYVKDSYVQWWQVSKKKEILILSHTHWYHCSRKKKLEISRVTLVFTFYHIYDVHSSGTMGIC